MLNIDELAATIRVQSALLKTLRQDNGQQI